MSAATPLSPLSWCAALVAVVFAVGTAAGGYVGRSPLHAELAQLRAAQAETARLQASAAAKALSQAQALGDALTDKLAQRQVQIDKISREKRDAINRLTTGRVCFSSAAVRVLNDDPADYGFEPMPPATGGADAADGAAATDADVGQWVITARAQYDTCRQRYHALIDWHAAPIHNPPTASAHDD